VTTQAQKDFLEKALAHAELAGDPFPEYSTCEAALESAWGQSRLAREANNLFGEHQHHLPIYQTYVLHPNDDVDPKDDWIHFPSWKESFQSHMDTIRRLANQHPHDYPGYVNALSARNGEDFVMCVSQHWAQDPLRGSKVLSIHKAHFKPTGEII
jgi:flagellum-specific peptidoglycan hydrolase FlgJ